MKVELLTYTPDADKLVAAAAKLCYAKSDIDTLMDKLTPEKVADFLKLLGDLGGEDVVKTALCDVALALYREGSDAVTGDLCQQSAGNTFDAEGEGCVFHRGFVTQVAQKLEKISHFFGGELIHQGVNVAFGVAELCGGSHQLVCIGSIGKQFNFHRGYRPCSVIME